MPNGLSYRKRKTQAAQAPEGYPQSRAAMRDLYGARRIQGAEPGRFAENDTTPTAIAARRLQEDPNAPIREGITPNDEWRQQFKPRMNLAPTIEPDVQAMAEVSRGVAPVMAQAPEMQRITGGGSIATYSLPGRQVKVLASPYGSGSSSVPVPTATDRYNDVINNATRNRPMTPLRRRLRANSMGFDPLVA